MEERPAGMHELIVSCLQWNEVKTSGVARGFTLLNSGAFQPLRCACVAHDRLGLQGRDRDLMEGQRSVHAELRPKPFAVLFRFWSRIQPPHQLPSRNPRQSGNQILELSDNYQRQLKPQSRGFCSSTSRGEIAFNTQSSRKL